MSNVTLGLIKAQLNLEHDLDDGLLRHKLRVAEEWIANHTGKPFVDPIPASFIEAALQLASFWYVNREAATDMRLSAVPFGVLELIAPYRESVTGHVAT
ncbi:MAG: phage gp6-like head-tail connector protein [Sulfitobacter sp. SK025]|nr:MAG: phage gp6-like head-tail connector protein [Sulfitobacter sp. SK025]